MRLTIRILAIASLLLTALGLWLTLGGAGTSTGSGLGTGPALLVASGLLLLGSGLLAIGHAVRSGLKLWWIGIPLTLLIGLVGPGLLSALGGGGAAASSGFGSSLAYFAGLVLPTLATLVYSFLRDGGASAGPHTPSRPVYAGLSIVNLLLLGGAAFVALLGTGILQLGAAINGPSFADVLATSGTALALVLAATLTLLALRRHKFRWAGALIPITLIAGLLVLLYSPLRDAVAAGPISTVASGAITVFVALVVPVVTLVSSLFTHRWSPSAPA
jgi:hypothetical protein